VIEIEVQDSEQAGNDFEFTATRFPQCILLGKERAMKSVSITTPTDRDQAEDAATLTEAVQRLLQVSFHEAAHALIAIQLDQHVGIVHAQLGGSGTTIVYGEAAYPIQLAILLAGEVAERLLEFPDEGTAREDQEQAARLLKEAGLRRRGRRETICSVKRAVEENLRATVPALVAIAFELMERDLTESDVRRIMAQNPEKRVA